MNIELPNLNEGELYAGIVIVDNAPSHHLILLPGEAMGIDWESAMSWAEQQGGTLPTRSELALLYANLRGEFEDARYWSSEQHASYLGCAWCQGFSYGRQSLDHKGLKLRARAVRRESIVAGK
jgi:hypothetical protein